MMTNKQTKVVMPIVMCQK